MATKTIKLPATAHVLDLENSELPVVYDQNYARVKGKIVVREIAPGEPVTLDAADADRLLANYGDKASLIASNEKEDLPAQPPLARYLTGVRAE